jgi:thermitase
VTDKLSSKTTKREVKVRKPGAQTFFFYFLVLVVLVQESVALFNFYSLGVAQEVFWYKEWPFNVSDFVLSKTVFDFAYNGSKVELIIGLRQNRLENLSRLTSFIAQRGGSVVNLFSIQGATRSLTLSLATNRVSSFLREVLGESDVEYVEPNWKFSIDAVPNDPEWINQWGPAKIEADKAWSTQMGNRSVLVAVVDTGIYYKHPDLLPNYVALGYDWVNDDNDPIDDHGHGTHCAGIVAAATNNGVGISGIAQVGVMAEKGLAYNGIGYEDDLANAIVHAVDQGADIISCSWGSSSDSQLIHDAVEYATSKGALVVAAAGNSGSSEKHYPAAYPEVVAVTATNEKDKLASFSTYGDWVDIAAPGASVVSTFLWGTYVSMSGTSMACPHVAGVAALVWSEFRGMSNEQVRSQLFYSADDLGASGFDVYFGHGRVNARKAVVQSVSLLGSRILDAQENSVQFLYINPSESGEAAYDVIAGGIIYGLCASPQLQSFTSAPNLLLSSGELNASAFNNSAVMVLGGPCPQRMVQFYEAAGLSPLRFAANDTYFMFLEQGGDVVAVLSRSAAGSGHEDLFLVEVFVDGSNLIVVMYGFTWRGTWASGICFKEVIAKNLNGYSENCYVFHWVDKGKFDGVPQSSEIRQEYPF